MDAELDVTTVTVRAMTALHETLGGRSSTLDNVHGWHICGVYVE